MNLHDPEQFRKVWDQIPGPDKTNDPRAIREAFEKDQEAEDEAVKRGEACTGP